MTVSSSPGGTHKGEPESCPVCRSNEWDIDYDYTDDGEMRVDRCARCGWPPPSPHSVEEWRDKWLTLGETPHSHPGPWNLDHIRLLLGLLDAFAAALDAATQERDEVLRVIEAARQDVLAAYNAFPLGSGDVWLREPRSRAKERLAQAAEAMRLAASSSAGDTDTNADGQT